MARDIIIGDVHGCFDELRELLDRLAATDEDRLISVGDLVDRGPRSVEVWELFRARPNTVVLMGNHERKHVRGVLTYAQEIVRVQFGERYAEFRAWAAGLPYWFETDDAMIVHGGFEDGVPLSQQRPDVLAGTTSGTRRLESLYGERYWTEVYSGEKPIVFGHHVVGDQVQRWNDRVYGIDTGACHGGFLSALVLPGFEVSSVKAGADYWTQEQRRWQLPVLLARPWIEYSHDKARQELHALRRRNHESEEVRAFTDALEAWLAGVAALVPALLERVAARGEQLRPLFQDRSRRREIAAEPYPGLLFAWANETLKEQTLLGQLGTPTMLVAAARAYGLDVSGLQPPFSPTPAA